MRDVIDLVAVRQLTDPKNETASNTGSAVDLDVAAPGNRNPLGILNVHGVNGVTNATLDVVIEGSDDGSTWATAGTFTQVTTAAAKEAVSLTPFQQYRYKSTLAAGGDTAPSYDLEVLVVAQPDALPAGTVYS